MSYKFRNLLKNRMYLTQESSEINAHAFITSTVPLETMGPFAVNLPRSIRGFDLRYHLGKTSSNRNKNLGFT